MPDGVLTRCDKCGHEWRARIEVRTFAETGELWWFGCPRCHERYNVARITKRGVELRGELVKARESGADEAEIARLEAEYSAEVTRLTGKEARDANG